MSNFASLLFYIVCFGASGLLLALYDQVADLRAKKALLLTGIAIPILFSALRYGVGIDYWSYDEKFKLIRAMPIRDVIATWGDLTWNYMEPSFYLIAKATGIVTGGSWLMFLVYALIAVGFFYAGVLRLNLKYSGLIFFLFLLLFFPQSFNAVRQFAALSITFYATISLITFDKQRMFAYLGVLAFFVHYTSLIYMLTCFVLYLIWESERLGRYVQMAAIPVAILFVTTGLFFIAKAGLLTDKMTIMADSVSKNSIALGAWLSSLLNNGIKLIFILPFYERLVKYRKDMHVYVLLFVVGTSMFLLTFIAHIFFFRISLYFTIYFVILLGAILELIENIRLRRLMVIFFVLFAVGSFTRANYLNDAIEILPYRSVLTEKSY